MKVWLVGKDDYESSETICLCATKKIAERELFKARDCMINEAKECIETTEKEGFDLSNEFDEDVIKYLPSDDYNSWHKNVPHAPYIREISIITE